MGLSLLVGCAVPPHAMPCYALPRRSCFFAWLHSSMQADVRLSPPQSTCVAHPLTCTADAGTYRDKALASGLAADANTGYSSGLGNVGAQGAGAR